MEVKRELFGHTNIQKRNIKTEYIVRNFDDYTIEPMKSNKENENRNRFY